MKLPNLDKIVGFLQDKLNLRNWRIVARWVQDLKDGEGKPVMGLCQRRVEIPDAVLSVRPPADDSPAEYREVVDTVFHEMVHCRLAELAAEGSVGAEERATYPMAALYVELLEQTPLYGQLVSKKMPEKTKVLLTSREEGAKERYKMDPEQLAALALEAGQLIAQEGLPEEVKSLLQKLIALAAGGSAEMPPEGEAAPSAAQPEEPPMGMQKEDELPVTKPGKAEAARALLKQIQAALGGADVDSVRLKAMEDQMATDRAAAVDGLLDARPDLSSKQRARIRELGLAQGVAKVRQDLAELIPPPPTAPTAAEQKRARLGLDAPPKRGGVRSGFRPSGNAAMMMRLRVVAEDDEEILAPGCKLFNEQEREETGKLFEMSIWRALPALRKSVRAEVQRRAKRMGGEA